GRALVTFPPAGEDAVRAAAASSGVPFRVIGTVGGERLRITAGGGTVVDEDVAALRQLWATAFAQALESAEVL
ncbi:MAG TPA: hypothetical protein VNC59_02690, partial [Thermoanaerobaculia bacterium]|nr:hypothetical protein [Thermoanaerobaculia bacterium]